MNLLEEVDRIPNPSYLPICNDLKVEPKQMAKDGESEVQMSWEVEGLPNPGGLTKWEENWNGFFVLKTAHDLKVVVGSNLAWGES